MAIIRFEAIEAETAQVGSHLVYFQRGALSPSHGVHLGIREVWREYKYRGQKHRIHDHMPTNWVW